MNKQISNALEPNGLVYRQTFSTSKLKVLLEKELSYLDGIGINLDKCVSKDGVINHDYMISEAYKLGLSKEAVKRCLDASVKKQFADNFIWRFLKKAFDIDLAIPFVTGYYSLKPLRANLITNVGHKAYADQIGGTTTTPVTAIAYGTGAVAAAATDTALGAEVSRGAATITNTTTTTTGDTEQWVKTFTAAGTQAITEEGLFDNNTSGGKMLARQVFSAVNMILNDTIQFTHKVQS